MTPYDIVCIAVGSWLVLSAVVAVPLGRAMRKDVAADAEQVNWIAELPPVPAPRFPVWDDVDEVSFRWFAEGSAR